MRARRPLPFPLRYRRQLKEAVAEALTDYRGGFYDMVRAPSPKAWGDLPPLLCLASSTAVGGDYRRALPAAAALELASRSWGLHQGLWGGALPLAWRRWADTSAQAINAGDALLTLARLTLLRLEERGVPHEQVAASLHLLDEALLRACGGRSLELLSRGRLEPDVVSLEEAARQEAGAIFRCSLEMGAVLGGGASEAIRHLGDFGEGLGMAYSLRRWKRPDFQVLIEEHARKAFSHLASAALPRAQEQELRQAAEKAALLYPP